MEPPAEEPAPEETTGEPAVDAEAASPIASLFLEPASVTSMIFQAPDLSAVVRPAVVDEEPRAEAEEGSEENELDEAGSRRRRRSRGRRGRRAPSVMTREKKPLRNPRTRQKPVPRRPSKKA
ncbi:ribonuclease [Arthrobacter sp. Hiyo8]|nr:ribonuclease [Arthrobacter sp. Hiyo8]